MKKSKLMFGVGLVALVAVAVLLYAYWVRIVPVAGEVINTVRSADAPAGELTVERATAEAGLFAAATDPVAALSSVKAEAEWPSYNGSLGSARFSPLAQINRSNVGSLKLICTYDTKQHTSFEAGLIMLNGALIGTTEHDIFSIDPSTCREKWRTHEDSVPSYLSVNHGAAYLDGLLFRGTGDGRVWAYEFATGKRVWEATVGDVTKGESTPAAPIAWNGLVFIGNSTLDSKGRKGRMYALDAKTGKIVWEFYLVPKGPEDVARGPQAQSLLDASTWNNKPEIPISGGSTWTSYTLDEENGELFIPGGNPAPDFANSARQGINLYSGSVVVLDAKTGAYRRHYQLVPQDWHDWDVSNAPALLKTRAGKRLMVTTPKDGHLYGFDRSSDQLLYREPVTRVENTEQKFELNTPVHFCPGSLGGGEWNGPGYDPGTNLIFSGEVDWCVTVTLQTDQQLRAVPLYKAWSGNDTKNPYHMFGTPDAPYSQWAGWFYASDADTGRWVWRAKSNYPIQSGVTPTAGGLVFFGDMGGNLYALSTATGERLLSEDLGGAIGGGIITYTHGGSQRVAVAVGFTSVIWPTKVMDAKVVILGLPST